MIRNLIMASEKAAVASGADRGDGLRQRVPSSQTAPRIAQPEDNKKLQKKVSKTTETYRIGG